MRYEKEIGRHMAGVIKTLIEAEANEVRSGRTKGVKKHKEIKNVGAYAVVQEAKRFHATPKAEERRCY